jgi:3'-phosphoadenosine 5'-phosphosulfate sulfotransferase (PAPS reductase)/FAD synthetase
MVALPMLADARGDGRVATTPEVVALLAGNAPVAIGVSGGKDSCAVAFATVAHLDRIGHTGPRVLVHADLGVTEWCDSLPVCERLAAVLGLELIVVRRSQGDMMDRWEQRWGDNLQRWLSLSCVKIILPWSTPSMRFCTSELKIDQITRDLCRRFPGQRIVNVTGIRAQESTERAKAALSSEQPKLASITHKTTGVNWNAILHWSLADVWACLDANNFTRHEAYTKFGASRVSCVWCILATADDHHAGARDERNHELGRRMVNLELVSTFGFQGSRWLGDTLRDILTDEQRAAVPLAKERAALREQAEARIPKHLLYTKDWPTCVPTPDEAVLLASVRTAVADALGLAKTFTEPGEIIARYTSLMAEKARRDAEKVAKANRKAAKLASVAAQGA